MEGGNRRSWPSWKYLKRRLGWNRINIFGFCRSSKWVLATDVAEQPLFSGTQTPSEWATMSPGSCISQIPGLLFQHGATTNLATALVAERRQVNVGSTDWMDVKPLKSLVRVIGAFDGRDVKVAHDADERRGGIGTLCCLCTERNKGAALIPCGHTYCRACSGAMWLKQMACPLCDRLIMDVFEMF